MTVPFSCGRLSFAFCNSCPKMAFHCSIISLVSNYIEHFLYICWPLHFLFEKKCSDHFPTLKVDYLSLLGFVVVVIAPYVFWILTLCQINSWQRFPHFCCFLSAQLVVSLAVQGVSVLCNPVCEFSLLL